VPLTEARIALAASAGGVPALGRAAASAAAPARPSNARATDRGSLPERDRAVAASQSPFGRIGAPEAYAFLAGDAGRWVTGQHIQVGGGVS
jgi:hypothetical protein